jgi:Domain of unknown function (DUF4126)
MIASIFLGIGLSASAGFRVFIPLLIAALAGKFELLPLTDSFQWMASWPAIICFGTATLIEIVAYYIPVVDNFLDLITTPMAILAGTLLATSVLPVDNDLLKWTSGILLGGGAAGVIQTGTSLLRLFSTKTTAGIANPVVSTAEHMAALGTSVFSILLPVIAGSVILVLIVYIMIRGGKKLFSK